MAEYEAGTDEWPPGATDPQAVATIPNLPVESNGPNAVLVPVGVRWRRADSVPGRRRKQWQRRNGNGEWMSLSDRSGPSSDGFPWRSGS